MRLTCVAQAGYFWRVHRPGYCQRASYLAGFSTLYALTVLAFLIEVGIIWTGLRGASVTGSSMLNYLDVSCLIGRASATASVSRAGSGTSCCSSVA